MLEKRQFHKLVALNGRLFSVGGWNVESGRLKSVECYDPLEKKWLSKTSMNAIRCSPAVAVHDDKIYVFGGFGDTGTEKSAEYYDPLLGQWITVNVFIKNYPNPNTYYKAINLLILL